MGGSRDGVAAGRASVQVSLANVINTVLGAALFALLPRILTAYELGVLATVTLSYTVFQLIGQFGLNRSAASLVSAALVDGEVPAARQIWSIVLLILGFSVAATIGAFLSSPYLAMLLVKDTNVTLDFQAGAAVVLANAFSSNLEGVMQGIRDFSLLSKSRVVGQIVRIAVSVILLLSGYRVLAIIVGLSLGQYGFVTILIQLPVLLRRYKFVLPKMFEVNRTILYSLPLYGVTLVALATQQLDLLLVIAGTTTAMVGVYSVVLNILGAVNLGVVLPVQGSFVPFMSKILKERGKLEQAFQKGTRYISLIVVPAVIALAALSHVEILIMAGPNYSQAALPLAISMIAMILAAFSALVNAALQSHGRNSQMLIAFVCGILVEAACGFFLVRSFGLVGAAVSRIILYVGVLTVGVIELRSTMHVTMDKQALKRGILISCAFLLIPIQHLVWNTLVGLIISSVAALALFLLAAKRLRVFTKGDAQLILDSAPTRMQSLLRVFRIYSLGRWLVTSEAH